MVYPIRQGAMYNLVLSQPAGDGEAGIWNGPGNIGELKEYYKDFDPVIRGILRNVKSLNCKVADLPPLPS